MNKFIDADQRNLAATALDQNVVVLAGAGTGKTRLLIDRLCLLILGKGVAVEKIVALTFTKKAAGEMRERLERRLNDILQNPETFPLLEKSFPEEKGKWEERAKAALQYMPKAQIGTIHSFAGHLLRLYPLQARVDPKFKEDEGDFYDRIFEQEWRLWLETELGLEAPRVELWRALLTQVEISDVKALAWRVASPEIELKDLSKKSDLKKTCQDWLSLLRRLRNGYPSSGRAKVFAAGLAAMESIFQSAIEGSPIKQEEVEAADRMDVSKLPQGWNGDGQDKITVRDQLKQLNRYALALSRVHDGVMGLVIEAVTPFVRRFRSELARRGSVSFEGLLVFARNLLRDHPDVRAELQKQYTAFLVDEFQDTDPLQGEILFYLAERPGKPARDWSQVQLEAGRLFVVGDPKQSIYRFRGADIAAFEAFHRHMAAQGALEVQLSVNSRSQAPLIHSINGIFSRIMLQEPGLQPPYHPLAAGREGDDQPGAEMLLLSTDGAEETPKAVEMREREAGVVARWIAENAGPEESGKKYRHKDVALLFRSANAFPPYLTALRERGIPYLAEGEKFFFQTHEVTEFLNLLASIANPDDKLSLLGVLRSPLGGLTDEEILELKEKDGFNYRQSPPVHAEKIGSLFGFLNRFYSLSHLKPVGQLIHEVFDETWALQLMCQSHYGEQVLANLFKVAQLADKWSMDETLTLKTFVKRFAQYREDEREEGENPLADAYYDAVKVMTIHKAKGLEFPIVILPNLCAGRRNSQSDRPLLLRRWKDGLVGLRLRSQGVINSNMVLLEEETNRRDEAEEVRVFYVASTRPKDKLVYVLRSEASTSSAYAQYFKNAQAWPSPDENQVKLEGAQIPVSHIGLETTRGEDRKPAPAKPLGKDWEADRLARLVLRRRNEAERLLRQTLFVSPTRLLQEPDKERFVEEGTVVSSDRAIRLGLLCHKVLEEWDFQPNSAQSPALALKAIDRWAPLFELNRSDSRSKEILDEAQKIMTAFLKTPVYEKLCLAHIAAREIPFIYSLDTASQQDEGAFLMRGVIDLLYQKDGRWIIADYKTTKTDGKSLSSIVEHYRPQAEAYVKALHKTTGHKADFELVFLRSGESVIVS